MKRVILTGFDLYGPYNCDSNPSRDVAFTYNNKKVGDVEVTGLVLPVLYHGCFNVLLEKIKQASPDAILNVGITSIATRLRLETFAKNIMNGKYPDANGWSPKGEPIAEGGNLYYPSTADIVELAHFLHTSGIPAEISVDSEGFMCNAILYQTSRYIIEGKLPIKNALVHSPWTDDYSGRVKLKPGRIMIPKEQLYRGVELLVNKMA